MTQMTEEEKTEYSSIHNTIIPKRKKKFQTKGIISNRKSKHKGLIKPLLEKTKEILDQSGKQNYDMKTYLMEFHQRNCGFEKKSKATFSWHQDDYAAVSYKVYTVIYYLRKDKTIQGGNLEYEYEYKKKKIQEINGGEILCFDGDLNHRPELCEGFGCRDIIVMFIKKK